MWKLKDSQGKEGMRRLESVTRAKSMQRQECALLASERTQWTELTWVTLYHDTSKGGSRSVMLFGLEVEGKQKGNEGEKEDANPQQHNDTRRSVLVSNR